MKIRTHVNHHAGATDAAVVTVEIQMQDSPISCRSSDSDAVCAKAYCDAIEQMRVLVAQWDELTRRSGDVGNGSANRVSDRGSNPRGCDHCDIPEEQDEAIDSQLRQTGECPHGESPADCDACMRLGDEAFDAARESRVFGGRM